MGKTLETSKRANIVVNLGATYWPLQSRNAVAIYLLPTGSICIPYASLIAKRGIVLDRWAQGLSVMLEKIFGCSLIMKLSSILLMEGDFFNASKKLIFGIGMLEQVRKYTLMPEEVFSKRNRLAKDGPTICSMILYNN